MSSEAPFFPPPSTQPPAPLVIEPTAEHTATVITIHGYGDDAYGWEMLPTAHKAALPQVKWIMPSAPLDELVGMRSWFDISDEAIQAWKKHGQKSDEIVSEPTQPVAMPTNVTKPNEEDPLAAFIPAIRYIHSLIDAELKTGIPSHRIAIVGFSQGGALALLASLLGEQRFDVSGNNIEPAASGKYAAIFPIGTFLPGGGVWTEWKNGGGKWKPSEANEATLHCLIHGTADLLVPKEASQTTLEILRSLGFQGCFYLPYNGVQHWVTEKQIQDLGQFLKGILAQ